MKTTREKTTTESLGAWSSWHDESFPIRVGISSCLLGQLVRYDGGHKRDRFLTDELGPWVEWVDVCPEVEIGMGTPRPSVRLVTRDDGLHMVEPKTGTDYTAPMLAYATERVRALQKEELDGYVLKKDSPSCGMERVKVWGEKIPAGKKGVGLYAMVLRRDWPHLPVEEEGRLTDPVLRENFVERLFCRNRWRRLVGGRRTRGRLVEFWTAHKMLVRAHDEQGYRRLGRLVGSARKGGDAELYARFEEEFFGVLARRATLRKNTNVLQHALGYLREALDADERALLLEAITDYHRGMLPLVVPLKLLSFQIKKHRIEYLSGQLYFEPHPKELMLRNRV